MNESTPTDDVNAPMDDKLYTVNGVDEIQLYDGTRFRMTPDATDLPSEHNANTGASTKEGLIAKDMKQKIITKVLVGSRLHGTNTDASDYDYRGIHIQPLKDVLSPFKTLKNTTWIEGDEDNTSYELADFCKQATHGNATILEVFFSDQIIETTPIADEMRMNWKKFMDTHRFIMASRGYAHNQWNKFYNFESQGVNQQERTAKFAVAFLRVMWQCEQFLLTGQFMCNLKDSDLFPLLKKIKPLTVEQIQPYLPEIVAAMSDMNMRVSVAESKNKTILTPDIDWIEDFIHSAYTM